ncbi:MULTISPECIES: BapA protein [Borreliella]|nr:BapA protein [Borreliella valaisiana]
MFDYLMQVNFSKINYIKKYGEKAKNKFKRILF